MSRKHRRPNETLGAALLLICFVCMTFAGCAVAEDAEQLLGTPHDSPAVISRTDEVSAADISEIDAPPEEILPALENVPAQLDEAVSGIYAARASDASLEQLVLLRRAIESDESDSYAEFAEFIGAFEECCGGSGDVASLCGMIPEGCALGADTVQLAAECVHAAGELSENTAVLTFTGDCTLGRFNEQNAANQFPSLYEASGSLTYPFDGVRHWFELDDMTVINFEGTLTESRKHANKKFFFRGDKDYAKILPASSVEVACMANNHVYDYKQVGFDDTLAALTEQGVCVSSAAEPVVETLNGIETVIISGGEMLYDSQVKAVTKYVEENIKKYKRPDNVVIVCLHWGVEYDKVPSKWQISLAHELIDAGADAIVGHHPHIIQGMEIYNGKVIAYSLGNFAFGGSYAAHSPETFMLRLKLEKNGGTAGVSGYSIVPCYISGLRTGMNDYRPVSLRGAEAENMVDLLKKRSSAISGGAEAFDWFGKSAE